MVSVLICSKYANQFLKCAKSIVSSSVSDDYEIIVKVDSMDDERHRRSILQELGAKHKIVENDVTGYENLHVMTNQMAEVAKGDLLWCMADDCCVTGDWYGSFREIQRQSQDNIFVINTNVGESWAVCPVVSRGWYEILGYVAACPTNDFFLNLVGGRCGRYLSLPRSCDLRIIHEQGAASGVPKRVRKPAMKRALRTSKYAARLIRRAITQKRGSN